MHLYGAPSSQISIHTFKNVSSPGKFAAGSNNIQANIPPRGGAAVMIAGYKFSQAEYTRQNGF